MAVLAGYKYGGKILRGGCKNGVPVAYSYEGFKC